MKFTFPRITACLAGLAFATAALAADQVPTSSSEKARQAMAVLQSGAPPAEQALACKQLAIYGQANAVPALAPLLTNPELASWALIALEAIPGKASDEALRGAMKEVQGRLLVGVINSIGVRRDAKAVSALVAKLKDPDSEVASAAAIALGRIGGSTAAKALQRALADSPSATRAAVAQGCILCAEQYLADRKFSTAAKLYEVVVKADVPQRRKLEATRGVILARQGKGLPLLLETLRSPDKATFNMGLHTARELPGRAVTEALAAEVSKTPPDRQCPLLLAIADRNDTEVLPAILASARNGSTELRLQAIAVLVRLGDPASVPVFFDTLSEGDGELGRAAKTALADWPDSQVDAKLCTRLPQATGNTRRLLVELAGQRHVAAALPELTRAARDSDPKLRGAGIKALGQTVDAADLTALTDLLIAAKSDDEIADVQAALEAACTRIPDKTACANKLIAVLPTSPAMAKCALLQILGIVGNATALTTVQAAMRDPEPSVRDTAVRVLADWPESPALPALFEVFCSTTDESHRFLALRGCVRLLENDGQSTEQKLKTFRELLARTQRNDDRKVILSGLANVADPAALELVEPLLAEPAVQAEAELAYINIATAIAKSAPAKAKAAATRLQAESKNQNVRDRAAKILGKAK